MGGIGDTESGAWPHFSWRQYSKAEADTSTTTQKETVGNVRRPIDPIRESTLPEFYSKDFAVHGLVPRAFGGHADYV